MRYEVKLYSGGEVFKEIVVTDSLQHAKQIALLRNPGATYMSANPVLQRPEPVMPLSVMGQSRQEFKGDSGNQPSVALVALCVLGLLIAQATGLLRSKEPQPSHPSPAATRPSPRPRPSPPQPESPSAAVTTQDAPAPTEVPREQWGAFAISPGTAASAWAKAYPSEDAAREAAIQSCGQTDCEAYTFRPGSAALARGESRWYYQSGQSSEAEAEQLALQRCQSEESSDQCRIVYSFSF